jgi:hypothetical protein
MKLELLSQILHGASLPWLRAGIGRKTGTGNWERDSWSGVHEALSMPVAERMVTAARTRPGSHSAESRLSDVPPRTPCVGPHLTCKGRKIPRSPKIVHTPQGC